MNNEFLQIRISREEKRMIQAHAKKEGVSMTKWIKRQLMSSFQQQYPRLIHTIQHSMDSKEAFAMLHDFLKGLSKQDFITTVVSPPVELQNTLKGNYIAAMVETAALQKNTEVPEWTLKYKGVEKPHFSSKLVSLRPHLLLSSPTPFRKRNIFIDSTIGSRI